MTPFDVEPCGAVRPLLSAWIDGRLGRPERHRVEHHLPGCGACAEVAEGMLLVLGAAEELLGTPRRRGGAERVRASGGDRFRGAIARFAADRRIALGRLARRIVVRRLLSPDEDRHTWPAPAESVRLARCRKLCDELLALGADSAGAAALMVAALEANDGAPDALAAVRRFEEEGGPLEPPLPLEVDDAAAAIEWARREAAAARG